MSAGYDVFKYADNFSSEEEYFKELIKSERERKNGKTGSNNNGTDNADTKQQ